MFAQTLPGQAEHQSIELFAGESDLCSEGVRHPVKTTLMQTAGTQPDADAVVHQNLHPGGTSVGEEAGMVRLGRAEDLDDPGQCSVGAAAHVQRLGGQPDGVDAYHWSRSRSQVAHAGAAETGHVTLMDRAPRWSSMTRSWAGACTVGDNASGSAMKDGADTGADASRLHLCIRFALRPWAMAIRATDASGLEHSARTWALRAALWCRRMVSGQLTHLETAA